MSITSIYHPTASDPEGQSAPQAGFQTGLTIGSMFGPTGAAVGAAIGTVVGGLDKGSRRRRNRAIRKVTRASYNFSGDVFSYAQEAHGSIAKTYSANMSSMTARLAASGGRSEGALATERGKILMSRDSELEVLNTELEGYRAGEGYKWMRKDYEALTSIAGRTNSGGRSPESAKFALRIGKPQGKTGRAAFTPEQYARLKKLTVAGANTGTPTSYQAYRDAVVPTLEEYEKFQFGNDAQKAEYVKMMDDRITRANAAYEVKRAIEIRQDKEDAARAQRENERGK